MCFSLQCLLGTVALEDLGSNPDRFLTFSLHISSKNHSEIISTFWILDLLSFCCRNTWWEKYIYPLGNSTHNLGRLGVKPRTEGCQIKLKINILPMLTDTWSFITQAPTRFNNLRHLSENVFWRAVPSAIICVDLQFVLEPFSNHYGFFGSSSAPDGNCLTREIFKSFFYTQGIVAKFRFAISHCCTASAALKCLTSALLHCRQHF